jgi:hypothetical protein
MKVMTVCTFVYRMFKVKNWLGLVIYYKADFTTDRWPGQHVIAIIMAMQDAPCFYFKAVFVAMTFKIN